MTLQGRIQDFEMGGGIFVIMSEKSNIISKKKEMKFVYPRSTKEFTRTRSEVSVHSRIELEFGNVGF